MPAQRERDVVRELERALRDGVCRTKEVGPGDELPARGADQHDNARKGRVREAVVPEPLVAQDQLVRPAAVHLGAPDEARGLRRGAVLLADGGQPVVAEAATGDGTGNVADQAGIEKVAARGMRIVVRHFEMTAAADLRGDLREQVLRWYAPVDGPQRPRIQGERVGEDLLEPHRIRVPNADQRRVRTTRGVADERTLILHHASLNVGAREVGDAIAHDGPAHGAGPLPSRDVRRGRAAAGDVVTRKGDEHGPLRDVRPGARHRTNHTARNPSLAHVERGHEHLELAYRLERDGAGQYLRQSADRTRAARLAPIVLVGVLAPVDADGVVHLILTADRYSAQGPQRRVGTQDRQVREIPGERGQSCERRLRDHDHGPGATGPIRQISSGLDGHRLELGGRSLERPVGDESLPQGERDAGAPQRPKPHATHLEQIRSADVNAVDEIEPGRARDGLPARPRGGVGDLNRRDIDGRAVGSEHGSADGRRRHALGREGACAERKKKNGELRLDYPFGRSKSWNGGYRCRTSKSGSASSNTSKCLFHCSPWYRSSGLYPCDTAR